MNSEIFRPLQNQTKSMKNKSSRRPEPGGKRIGKSRPTKISGKGPKRNEERNEAPKAGGYKKRALKPAPSIPKNIPAKKKASDTIRLNKYLANAGVCSRREADTFISAGMVTVNGEIISEMGYQVKSTDEVRFDGQLLNPEKKVYLLLNKPKNFVTTTDDPHADKIVMDLVKSACEERIYPVGRLDRNTTGVLLFTNDGDLSKRLTHPSHTMKKIYQVSLDKPVTKAHLDEIANGIQLEDGLIAADEISYVNNEEKTEVGIEIHSGKNRIVRRIFEHFGYRVKKLDRVYFAGLTKKNLPRGKWRFLDEKEVRFLKMN